MPSLLTSLLGPFWDEKVEPFLDRKFDEVTDKTLAILPLLAAAAAAGAADKVVKSAISKASDILESDPDIPVLSDMFDLSEFIRKAVNEGTPAGIHIPALSDLGNLFNRDPKL